MGVETPSLKRAFQLQQTGDFAAAEHAYRAILADDPQNDDAHCGLGLLCEAQGRLSEALKCFDQTIRFDSRHVDGHLHRAKLFHLGNQTAEAERGYRNVLQIDPQHPVARVSLANIAYRDGRLAEAEQHLRQAAEQHPQFAFAHHSLGRVLHAQGDLQAAAAAFRRAIELDADFVENFNQLGAVYTQLGEVTAAENAFRQALRLTPDNTAILNRLGLLLLAAGRHQESAAAFRRALEVNPALAEAQNNLGLALNALDDHQPALRAFQLAMRARPGSPDILANLASTYLALGKLDEAEGACREALKTDPKHVAALSQRGLAGMRRGHVKQALSDFQSALKRQPTLAEAHNNLGTVLYALNRHDEAADRFSRALELNPEHVEAHYNRGLTRLRQGDFVKGWPDYEWRRRRKGTSMPQWGIPEWDGTSPAGKSLLIYGEQGIGDELMFAGCYEYLIKRAAKCLLVCERRLVPLFSRSFPTAIVFAANDRQTVQRQIASLPVDDCVAAGSVPRFLWNSSNSAPLRAAYLKADADRIARWKNRYAKLNTKFHVGVSWRGGADAETINRRSADLSHWNPLWWLPDVSFINLQYGDCREDLKRLRQHGGREIHDYEDADPLKDLDDFAAQIAALDLVISVDNSTVHMAGGLGVPTWVAVPKSADWRWGTQGETTRWYPSVRLFRRADEEPWHQTFSRMAGALSGFDFGGVIAGSHARWRARRR